MDRLKIGVCGEHYVAAYLSGNDVIVALPRAGIQASDLFIAHPETGYPLRVQVKTGTDSKRKSKGEWFYEWQMSLPKDKHCNDSTWYAFVWLNKWPKEPGPPEIAFIPSTEVLARMKADRVEKEPSFSSFWMSVADIEKYQNDKGLELMRQSMMT